MYIYIYIVARGRQNICYNSVTNRPLTKRFLLLLLMDYKCIVCGQCNARNHCSSIHSLKITARASYFLVQQHRSHHAFMHPYIHACRHACMTISQPIQHLWPIEPQIYGRPKSHFFENVAGRLKTVF